MLSEAFAAVLRSGRDNFNARFAHAKRQYPSLDAGSFSDFLVTTVDPVVRAVAAVRPECSAEVAVEAYDVALALAGQRLASSSGRASEIAEGWRRLATAAPTLFVQEPRRMLASVSNALHTLATPHGCRPMQWISEMERLSGIAASPDEFLRAGQVVAWRCGLAHFRTGALEVADTLAPALALGALGASATEDWSAVRARLGTDRWYVPGETNIGLRLAGRAGDFRGFGGLFTEPPMVTTFGDDFLVRSGADCWLLMADAFGATFHRALEAEKKTIGRDGNLPADLKVGRGTVSWQGAQASFPMRGEVTSTAASGTTLALTSTGSHAVLLVALS